MSHSNIEPDRQSAMSSFYRGRKDSFDALGGAADPTTRDRHDSSSSFFQPNNYTSGNNPNRFSRGSGDMLVNPPSAGYNRDSFLNPGRTMPVRGLRDEEEGMGFVRGGNGGYGKVEPTEAPLVGDPGWDVYNDFNNKGPRYSEAFGTGLSSLSNQSSGYHELPTPRAKTETQEDDNVELVTVPGLGPDWKKSEIENMRKSTKRDEKNYERLRKLKLWWRDQYGFCGGSGTRKVIVVVLFVLACIVGIVLAVTIPRVPSIIFNTQNPISNGTNADVPTGFSRSPANFSFPAHLNFEVNTNANVIPLKINSIQAQVLCLDTDVPVGTGSIGSLSIPAKHLQNVPIPVTFNYTAVNDSDTTWLQFYNACRNPSQYVDGVRPGFNLRVVFTQSIAGLVKKVTSSAQLNKIGCPFELPNNSV